MRSSTSSDSAYKCEVPVIVTECTEEEGIELNEEGLLRGTYTSDTGASSDTPASVVFDGSLYEEYVSNSAECFAEISFGTGKVGIVRGVVLSFENLPVARQQMAHQETGDGRIIQIQLQILSHNAHAHTISDAGVDLEGDPLAQRVAGNPQDELADLAFRIGVV